MTYGTPGRRELVAGGSAGLALGALGLVGLVAAPAQAAGVDTRAGLTAALDRYMATRAGVAGLAVRDNRTGRTSSGGRARSSRTAWSRCWSS